MFPHISSKSKTQSFLLEGNALRVTDPCYATDVWCSGQLPHVMPGRWLAHVGYHQDALDLASIKAEVETWQRQLDACTSSDEAYLQVVRNELAKAQQALAQYHGRVAYLHIAHESVAQDPQILAPSRYQKVITFEVGVDSGQAGFFEASQYAQAVDGKQPGQAASPEAAFESFYSQVCELTLSPEAFGVVPFGVAASSGYGDGGYDCFYLRDGASAEAPLIAAYILFIAPEEEITDELE